MVNKALFESMDRTFRDILGYESPFGGIPTLFSGEHIKSLKLTTNMQAKQYPEFSIQLLSISEGELPSTSSNESSYEITLPENFGTSFNDKHEFINAFSQILM